MREPDQSLRTHKVDKAHHKWVPTSDIAVKLSEGYPTLEFPWLQREHEYGVNSIVTGVCRQHHKAVPMVVGNLWRGTTKYGCPECAIEFGTVANPEDVDLHKRYRNLPGYIGRSRMEFDLYCAIKEKYVDAYPGYKMKGRKEIDIWVPSLNCGVEYNGNYYHSEAVGRGKSYHLLKSDTGWKEEKFIFHVFTEEANNIPAIIRSMELFSEYYKVANGDALFAYGGATLNIGHLSVGQAMSFHLQHNPIRNYNLPDPDWHIGVYDDSYNLVCALSGIRRFALITKITVAAACVRVDQVLDTIRREFRVVPAVWIDTRNPLEMIVLSRSKLLTYSGGIEPLPLPLDKEFKILKGFGIEAMDGKPATTTVPGEVCRAWDTGRLICHMRGHRPSWLPK